MRLTRKAVPLCAGVVGVVCLIAACPAALGAAPLRLIGRAGDQVIDNVTVVGRELRVGGEEGQPVPRGVRWELQGDLQQHAPHFVFWPDYEIVTTPTLPSTAAARTRTHGIIRLRRSVRWTERDLRGSIVVFVWLVSGKPVWVGPVPANLARGPSEEFAAVAALELDAETARGAPAVLLLREGSWFTPKPEFDEEPAHRALAELFLGSLDGFAREVALLKKIDVRTRREHDTLLHFTATAGRVDALRALLERGAKPRGADLVAAAGNDRRDCSAVLIAAGLWPMAKDDNDRRPINYALRYGHLQSGLDFQGDKPTEHLVELLALAVAQDNLPAVRSLLTMARDRPVRRLQSSEWASGVATGDAELVQLLLRAGMKADAAAHHTPLLVTAAARGDVESVVALIGAGARVNHATREGITPLMAAAYNGRGDVLETLLQAGADATQTDDKKQPALTYAAVAGHDDLAEVLRTRSGAPSDASTAAGVDSTTALARLAALRTSGATIFPESAVELPPVIEHHAAAAASTRVRQNVQAISVPVAYSRPLEPGSPVYVGTQIQALGTPSHESLTNHWAAVSLVVEPDGTPSCVQVVRAVSKEFAEAVEEAANEYRFLPGEKSGAPVRTRMTIAVTIDD